MLGWQLRDDSCQNLELEILRCFAEDGTEVDLNERA